MSGKTHMSHKTKKVLIGVGIGFGTVMVFMVSFILAFSLIVNPINFFTVSDAKTVEQNEKLKEEVQTLNDEIEHLNTAVEKYKAEATASRPSASETVTTSTADTKSNEVKANTQKHENAGQAQTPVQPKNDGGSDAGGESVGGFSPDTVDSTSAQTPEDVEEPITVIDVSD